MKIKNQIKEVSIEFLIKECKKLTTINPIMNLTIRYKSRNKVNFIGRVFDIYTEYDTENPREYLIFYNTDEKKYERRLFKNFLGHESIESNFEPPQMLKRKYILSLYPREKANNINSTHYIDYITDFDSSSFLIHLVGTNTYSVIKKKNVKCIREVIENERTR